MYRIILIGPIVLLAACSGTPYDQADEPDQTDQPEALPPPMPDDDPTRPDNVDGLPDEPPPADPDSARVDHPGQPAWWLDEPVTDEQAFRATVHADADSVPAARAAAVESALALVQTHFGAPRPDAQIEKTFIVSPEPGTYRAFVLVRCDAPIASAGVGDQR